MTFFRNFTPLIWEIFYGNLLLLLCTIFYIAWWTLSFKPDSNSSASGGIYIGIAFLTGIAALAIISHSISTLSQYAKGMSIRLILAGSAVVFVIMLLVTVNAFHRILTSELIIIHVWTALELCAVAALYGTGRFSTTRAAFMYVLIGAAFAAAMVCYVLYYRQDETGRYWVGTIPLIADGFTALVFAAVLAGA